MINKNAESREVAEIFNLDYIGSFPGFHDPEVRFNGFATPEFTEEVAKQIVSEYNSVAGVLDCPEMPPMKIDIQSGRVWMDVDEESEYFAEWRSMENGRYAIGSFSWCWIEDEVAE